LPLDEALPVLGVGASLSFGVAPDPLELAQGPDGPAFIEYAGPVSPEPFAPAVDALRARGVPVLYHPSCLNLCGPWANPPGWLAEVQRHVRRVGSPWLAQDVSVCFAGPVPGYSIQLGYFLPPLCSRAGLEQAVRRVSEVRAAVDAPLLLEPPPVTFRWGDIPMMAWLAELADRTACGLLLDAGHLLSHQLVEGRDPLADLPMERVFELHVAGGLLRRLPSGALRYQDAHELPVQPEVWALFGRCLAAAPHLKAVCVEVEGAAAGEVRGALDRARQLVAVKAANPALRAALRPGAAPAAPPERPRVELGAPPPPGPEEDPGYGPLLAALLDGDAPIPAGVDPAGFALDADGRRRYLLSALCRSFPRSAALLGALPGMAPQIARFLGQPAMFGPLSARAGAFGAWLAGLLDGAPLEPAARDALAAILDLERALIDNAGRARAAAAAGALPAPGRPKSRGVIRLPPYTLVAVLPCPSPALDSALDGAGAGDAWRRVVSGDLDPARIEAVLRAPPGPATLVARAVPAPGGPEGGEVQHRTVELRGARAGAVAALAGERLEQLPPAQAGLARALVGAGVLELS
jgi:uncharacterized protein (UPF0276 family)